MSTIKTFKAKTVINLFDSKTQKRIEGVLFFSNPVRDTKPVASSPTPKVSNRQWIEQNYISKRSKLNVLNFKFLTIFFFLVSIIGFSSLALPVAFAEVNLRLNYLRQNLNIGSENQPQAQIQTNIQIQAKSNQEEIDQYLVKKELYPLPLNFSITIPKIGVTSEVIPNVDPSSPDDYNEKLMQGVAHAKGSYLPGQQGTIFLFAHSTNSPFNILQYNAKFYAAKDLDFGDEIIIDYHGITYKYIVESKHITEPNDLETIRNSGADLILQTCWPPGTDWNRLLILAKEVN